MIYSENEILQYIEEHDVKFVKLTFCGLDGKLKNISVLSSEMGGVFQRGLKITAKKIKGFLPRDGKDLYLFPDAATMTLLPWRPQQGRVIRMFCYIRYADGTPFEGDSRYFLKKAMKEAVKRGYCFRFGTSCEFTLFRNDENGFPTKTPHDYAGYCDIAPDDKGENFRRDVCLTLEQMGIHPISSRHESGPGQHEIDFNASSALKAADTFLSFKSAVKSVAENHGVHASFMPKPSDICSGNGMHILMSIIPDDDFFSDDSDDKKEFAGNTHGAAGILKYIKDMSLFTNSTINSYRRLSEFPTPRYITWSDTDDDCIMRLIKAKTGEPPITLRASDCACNPYLVFGLMIYAALEGIEEQVSLPEKYESGNNSFDTLPENIGEAAELSGRSSFLKEILDENVLSYAVDSSKKVWEQYSLDNDKDIYEEKNYFYDL